jgi:hypothetical protein
VRDPRPDEILLIQILDATAGTPAEFRRWVRIARKQLPKRGKGQPMKVDTFWLLCAEALQRHDSTLTKTAAIVRIAELFWAGRPAYAPTDYATTKEAFCERLLGVVRNTELAAFAANFSAACGMRVEYNPKGCIDPLTGPSFRLVTFE